MMQYPDEIIAAIRAFEATPGPLPLHCGVQHYSWGDPDFIPALIGVRNPGRLPFAERWVGAHADLPSTVQLGGCRLSLAELIAAAPITLLGAQAASDFNNQLPFLLKILAAREPLSIQAHPTREQAIAGYQHEDAIGLPLTDPRRSYRDCNHKPELLVALTDFYALRGFRPLPEINAELAATPELAPLHAQFEPSPNGLLHLYRWLMQLEQAQVNALLAPLIRRLQRERAGTTRAATRLDPSGRHERDRHKRDRHERDLSERDLSDWDHWDWLLTADRIFSTNGQHDRGLFSLLLLNLIALKPGAALFLPAGELHAYLHGAAIELMANSNNVLRGGLTEKHIDVPALLTTLRVDPAPAVVLQPQPPAGPGLPATYATPTREFLLERYQLSAGEHCLINRGGAAQPEQALMPGISHPLNTAASPETAVSLAKLRLGLLLDGEVSLHSPKQAPLILKRGAAFVLPAACRGELRSARQSLLFMARLP